MGRSAVYGELIDVRPAGAANAFPYVIVPPIELGLAAVAVFIAARLGHRSTA